MNAPITAIAAARQQHSARCRQRVIKALNEAMAEGGEISISSIARRAAVDRSLLYRHRDLHSLVMAKAAEAPVAPTGGPAVSRASLIADLATAHDRITRLSRENCQLRERLSEALGDQAWRESGLGGPDDIGELRRGVTHLEQLVAELRRQLADKNDELDAARATNRELMTSLNRSTHPATATPRDRV